MSIEAERAQDLPNGWASKRGDNFLRFDNTIVDPHDLPDDAVFHYSIPSIQETGDGAVEEPGELDSAKHLIRGTRVLVSKLNPRKGVVILAEVHNIPTVASTELVPLEVLAGDPVWVQYLYMSHVVRETLSARVQSATRSHQRVDVSDIVKLQHFVPPLESQRAIAAFLDRKTAEIDALVAKKERLIELLEEKRTALITHAVTKGLDPDVKMKESGVEWLGAIPQTWAVAALLRVTISRCDGPFGSGLKSEHYSASGVRVIRLQNIGWTEFLESDEAFVDGDYAAQLGDHSVRAEDLLIAGLGDEAHPVGRACVAPNQIEPAIVKADCFRFRLDRGQLFPRFAAYQLSATAAAAGGSLATGATRARMNLSAAAARKLAIPTLKEQTDIVLFLDAETERFQALIGNVSFAIDHLKEYRSALITAAVTGQMTIPDAPAEAA